MRGNRVWAYQMVLGIGLSCAYATSAWALTYPTDGTWLPLTQSSIPIADVAGDSAPPDGDVVGNAEYPMAFVQSDSTYLYFRLRSNHEILQTATKLRPYGWGCVIDTNGDTSSFEYSAILSGTSGPDSVSIWENLIQDTPNAPNDMLPNMPLYAYLGPFNPGQPGYGYARQVLADSNIGTPNPDPDYFADWAIERSKLAPAVGALTPLRFACGSSNNGRDLNNDFSGPLILPDLFSDPVICDETGCHVQTCPEFGTECSVGVGVCAGVGIMVCGANGAVCNAPVKPSSTEICNGLDDDCDGVVDDGVDAGEPCTAGVGACMSMGQTVCTANGTIECDAVPGKPSAELCGNDVDEDCDGSLDNGLNLGAPCSVGVGACVTMGQIVCSANGMAECNAVPGQPADEMCGNQVDEDCDGSLDNGLNLGGPCSVGVGACVTMGTLTCGADGTAACDAVPGKPADELCGNQVDEDCDGVLDNGCKPVDPDGGTPPPQCTSASDCPSGTICVDGACQPQCLVDSDCPFGTICLDAVCQEGCRGDNPVACPLGEVCSATGSDAGQCVSNPNDIGVIAQGGGCDCQMGSSGTFPSGFAWTLALVSAVLLRRKRR